MAKYINPEKKPIENEQSKYKKWNMWTNPYNYIIYNPVTHGQIDSKYMSDKMESTKKCHRCINLQERNKRLQEELEERMDRYKSNMIAGVNKRALEAQKRVIQNIEDVIIDNQNKIDFHGNHG